MHAYIRTRLTSQADLKTIAALGCYGSSVLTGLTAQNTQGVQAVHVVPAEFVVQQVRAVPGSVLYAAWNMTLPLEEIH